MEEKFKNFVDATFREGSKRTRSALIRRSFADRIVKCLKSLAEDDRNFRHFVKKSEFQSPHVLTLWVPWLSAVAAGHPGKGRHLDRCITGVGVNKVPP